MPNHHHIYHTKHKHHPLDGSSQRRRRTPIPLTLLLLLLTCLFCTVAQPTPTPDDVIERYLQTQPPCSTRFHIQGWRWHTLSLIRDAGRLGRLALNRAQSAAVVDIELDQAADHVIGFNMKGLYAVEDELFFPWLRSKLTGADGGTGGIQDVVVRQAFADVMDQIVSERSYVTKLAGTVREQARIASQPNVTTEKRVEAASNMAQMASSLQSRTREIFQLEEKFLVPAVAMIVSDGEQKAFNSRVIRKLGILDSRLHLVGMHDTVMLEESEEEKALFSEYIPMIPRMMIPRWKRTLYKPKAGILDEF